MADATVNGYWLLHVIKLSSADSAPLGGDRGEVDKKGLNLMTWTGCWLLVTVTDYCLLAVGPTNPSGF